MTLTSSLLASLLLATTLGVAACGSVAVDAPPADTTEHPTWLVGSWRASDDAGSTITLASDGTARSSEGASGAWKYDSGTLTLGKQSVPIAFGVGCRVVDIGGRIYVSDSLRAGCPTAPAPLSSDEACLVGDYTIGTTKYHLESDRFYREEGAAAPVYGTWSLVGDGVGVAVTSPTGKADVRTNVGTLASLPGGMSSTCRTKLRPPTSCTANGDACADSSVCCFGLCASFAGADYTCVQACTRNEDCASGCCAAASGGKGSVCATTLYCTP